MGDLAVHIAERARDLASNGEWHVPTDLRRMSTDVQRMVRSSLESLVNHDSELAMQVMRADNQVDDHHSAMFALISQELQKNPHDTARLLQLLSVSRHLERIADQATNIAEDVYYLVEGEIIRHRAAITD